MGQHRSPLAQSEEAGSSQARARARVGRPPPSRFGGWLAQWQWPPEGGQLIELTKKTGRMLLEATRRGARDSAVARHRNDKDTPKPRCGALPQETPPRPAAPAGLEEPSGAPSSARGAADSFGGAASGALARYRGHQNEPSRAIPGREHDNPRRSCAGWRRCGSAPPPSSRAPSC